MHANILYTHFMLFLCAQMVEMLHRAMELKTMSETFIQLEESEDHEAPFVKPLERVEKLKQELDHLTKQSKKYVDYHHLFAKIPSSKRHISYQYVCTFSANRFDDWQSGLEYANIKSTSILKLVPLCM